MENIIELNKICKQYTVFEKREGIKNSLKDFFCRKYTIKNAVTDLDLKVKKGEIIGLLGKNGAGKTTTLKMLTGILHPTSGEIRVMGIEPSKRKADYLKRICFVMGNKSDIMEDNINDLLSLCLFLKEINIASITFQYEMKYDINQYINAIN